MAPELVPLAAPVPLPSWFEWAKLIVPPIITGLVVLTGAYITYLFANRGRKEDILYKERYKGFEEMSGYLYTIEDLCLKYDEKLGMLENYLDKSIDPEDLMRLIGEINQELTEIKKLRPNNKYLTLQHEGAAADYLGVLHDLELLDFLYDVVKEYPIIPEDENDEYAKDIYEDLKEHLTKIRIAANETIEAALKHLKLPNR